MAASAKAKGVVARPARAPSTARHEARGEAEPQAARSLPSELAVLLAEVQRLQGELAAAQGKVKELEASAETDALTGVFNRRGFDRELRRSLAYVKRYASRAALFYIDLDGFKPVNDTHGHAAGDAILKASAAMLTQSVRASDTVARLGGDEFGLILWNLGEADAAAKAWSLEAAIAEVTIEWEGETLSVGASIGFAMLSASDELADVLAKADHAMYARKAARKGSRLPQYR